MNRELKVVTIGEIMLGLRAPHASTLEGAPYLECLLSGTEANVAIGLTRLGINSAWIGKMPNNPIGRGLIAQLRGTGVDVSHVIWAPKGRVGIMYIQLGAFPRPNQAVYDRENSAASTLGQEEVNWDVVKEASHLHLTGITPALSKKCLGVTKTAIRVAEETKVTISLDVNYRSALWSPPQAGQVLAELIPNANVLFINVQEAKDLFNISGEPEEVVKQLKKAFGNETVILSKGAEGYIAIHKGKIYRGEVYPVVEINRFGVGDAFNAGFIYGFLTAGVEEGLDYGAAMAALKLTLPHVNYPFITREEVQMVREQKSAWGGHQDMTVKSHQILR